MAFTILLQKIDIIYLYKVNQAEYTIIYDDVNKPYYVTFNPDSKLRTNLVHILHQADFLASKIEYDRWKNTQPAPAQTPVKTRTSTGKPAVSSTGLAAALKNI